MVGHLIKILLVISACAVASCSDEDAPPGGLSTYESVEALDDASQEAPGTPCGQIVALTPSGLENLRPQFPGIADLGGCTDGGKYILFVVFGSRDDRDQFIGSQLWVDLQRVFYPVEPDRKFKGVAGENWLITAVDPEDDFVEEMRAERVTSVPAE